MDADAVSAEDVATGKIVACVSPGNGTWFDQCGEELSAESPPCLWENLRDDRPFMDCTRFDGANRGGDDTGMCMSSGDTAARTSRTSRACQIRRIQSLVLSATSPLSIF